MARFGREASSREPSIWDTYQGEYPAISAWGAPSYQYWYPYPFTSPSNPKAATPTDRAVSPSEKLEDPLAAMGGSSTAPSGGSPFLPGASNPLADVAQPAVGGSLPVEGGGRELIGGEGNAGPQAPDVGDITGPDPGALNFMAQMVLGGIPNPFTGPAALAAEAARVGLGQSVPALLSGVPSNMQEVTVDSQGQRIRGEPVVPSSRVMGLPLGPFMPRGQVENAFGGPEVEGDPASMVATHTGQEATGPLGSPVSPPVDVSPTSGPTGPSVGPPGLPDPSDPGGLQEGQGTPNPPTVPGDPAFSPFSHSPFTPPGFLTPQTEIPSFFAPGPNPIRFGSGNEDPGLPAPPGLPDADPGLGDTTGPAPGPPGDPSQDASLTEGISFDSSGGGVGGGDGGK